MTRPDSSEWYRLSDFGSQNGEGFTGVAFTPNGTHSLWAQIVGCSQLIIADFQQVSQVSTFTNRGDIAAADVAWIEPGNFTPDGKSLLITADTELTDPQGMALFIVDITTGNVRNRTNSSDVWDEHGVSSPDGKKVPLMSSSPFRGNPLSNSLLFLKTEFMLMDSDGPTSNSSLISIRRGIRNPTRPGREVRRRTARGVHGREISDLNLFFPHIKRGQSRSAAAAELNCPFTESYCSSESEVIQCSRAIYV